MSCNGWLLCESQDCQLAPLPSLVHTMRTCQPLLVALTPTELIITAELSVREITRI